MARFPQDVLKTRGSSPKPPLLVGPCAIYSSQCQTWDAHEAGSPWSAGFIEMGFSLDSSSRCFAPAPKEETGRGTARTALLGVFQELWSLKLERENINKKTNTRWNRGLTGLTSLFQCCQLKLMKASGYIRSLGLRPAEGRKINIFSLNQQAS